MARIRAIKIGFFTNELLCSLPPLTRILFAGLWVIADKKGRLEDRPHRIKIEVLPYDEIDVDAALTVLASTSPPFISRYVHREVRYIQIANWSKHQRPHHTETESVIPAPRRNNGERTVTVSPREKLGQVLGTGFRVGVGKDQDLKPTGASAPALALVES
jgi:hypothetical protein